MLHIDEARLHEYLDSLERGQSGRAAEAASSAEGQRIEQHLAECAECAALLEEVQLIRDRASALLRDAAPAEVSMPPFEEIEARARAVGQRAPQRAPRRVFTMNRLTALGWAATIVLAVGVGWLARGSFFGPSQHGEFDQTATAALEQPAVSDAVSGADEASSGAPAEMEPAQEATRRRTVQAPAEEESRPPMPERLEMAAAPPPEPERTDVPAEGVAEPGAPAAAKADEQRDQVTRQAVAGVAAEAEAPEAPGRGAAKDADPQLDEGFAGAAWSVSARADAERHLGGELRFVEGLPIDSIRTGEIDGRHVVIVGQSLPGGETLEIVQWRRDEAEQNVADLVVVGALSADQMPAARPEIHAAGERQDLASFSTVSNEFLIVLRAHILSDSLAALAARIRP